MNCPQEWSAADTVQDGWVDLFGTSKDGLELALFVNKADFLKNLSNGLFVESLLEIFLADTHFAVICWEQ